MKEVLNNVAFMDGYFRNNPEFLIMENGSNLLYKRLEYDSHLRYYHRAERGLGWALREGIRRASWPTAFFLPADLSYDLSFVAHAKPYLETGYSMVIGSKALGDSEVHRPFKREMMSAAYNLLLKLRYGPGWPSDITGTKAYRRRDILGLLDEAPSDGISFEVQLMAAMKKASLKVKEISVKVDDHRSSPFNLFGSRR